MTTVYIIGAGATRGCSFVDAANNPCLPPLDFDFFTMLQRIRDPRHSALVKNVLQDVIELFGTNFNSSMENVFSTTDQTLNLLKNVGDNRAYKYSIIKEMQDRLVKAIGAVLDDSLCQKTYRSKIAGGKLSFSAQRKIPECENHRRLIQEFIEPKDCIIGFNYDCVIDYALKNFGDNKWNPKYGYGIPLGKGRNGLTGYEYWEPATASSKLDTVKYLKLHGSLHFKPNGTDKIELNKTPYQTASNKAGYVIIPPEWNKKYSDGIFLKLWQGAAGELSNADKVVFIGYSMPLTDMHSSALFQTSLKSDKLKALIVVNPDKQARFRVRDRLRRVINEDTKVLSFDGFRDFLAFNKKHWTY